MAERMMDIASGLFTAVQAKFSPNTVQAIQPDKLIGFSAVKHSGNITLYHRTSAVPIYECVVTKPDMPSKMYSLFRRTGEIEANELFNYIVATMAPIIASCLVPFNDDVLRKIMDCLRDHPTWTCAHVAAYLGYYTCLKCPGIIDFTDIPCKNHHMTPLMVAIVGKQSMATEELLRLGVDLSKKDNNGDTAYHHAVVNCPPIVSLLIDYDKAGVINWLNGKGESALLIACQQKLSDATEMLIAAGANPRIATADCLPIHAAVKSCDMRSVESIIKAYPDQANAKDFKYGGTPIHWAENLECIQKLAYLGCNLNILNNAGNAPLHVMMEKKRLECQLALLCHGADCNVMDSSGETVLHKAIKADELELVRQFVVFGANINQLTGSGQSPRHLAATSCSKSGAFFKRGNGTRHTILYLLHVSGAHRCDTSTKGCQTGCAAEGTYNGVADDTMSALMKLDSVALSDDQMMATVVHSASSPQEQNAVIEMVDTPVSAGDRVLCLDGGGIRGLVLIQMLIEIEAAVGKPIKECFDWIGGTSTGALLALGIAKGLSLQYLKGMYVRLKDEVFKGKRPYDSTFFEEMLKRELGEDAVMSDIKHPKILVTAVLADRYPADLFFFRNFEKTFVHMKTSSFEVRCEEKKPSEQKIWEAARSSGAAPTYFRGHGPFLDGGLISNNPTLDVLTEIHEYNLGLKLLNRAEEARPIGCVISLGCGRIPVQRVENMDVFLPQGLFDVYKAVSGATALGRLIIDQASISEGRPVDRARAWCSMINVPYYRFSPLLSKDIALDCHEIKLLTNMMWETHCYMVANSHRLAELASLLRGRESTNSTR